MINGFTPTPTLPRKGGGSVELKMSTAGGVILSPSPRPSPERGEGVRLLSPPPLRGRARVGGDFAAILAPCRQTTPVICATTLPTRSVAFGHTCATGKSMDTSSAAKPLSVLISSISSAFRKNLSSRSMAGSTPGKLQKTRYEHVGWNNAATEFCDSGIMKSLRTPKAWSKPSVTHFLHYKSAPTLTLPREGRGNS